MLRLYPALVDDSIGPWSVGAPLKLAVAAMMAGIEIEEVGVSNAVPWSRQSPEGQNVNPDSVMQESAAMYWRDLVDVWKPRFSAIVTAGNIARAVIRKAGLAKECIPLLSASPNQVQRVQGMFDRADLLKRYPEVVRAAEAIGAPEELENASHVFYACHAVSLAQSRPVAAIVEALSRGHAGVSALGVT